MHQQLLLAMLQLTGASATLVKHALIITHVVGRVVPGYGGGMSSAKVSRPLHTRLKVSSLEHRSPTHFDFVHDVCGTGCTTE